MSHGTTTPTGYSRAHSRTPSCHQHSFRITGLSSTCHRWVPITKDQLIVVLMFFLLFYLTNCWINITSCRRTEMLWDNGASLQYIHRLVVFKAETCMSDPISCFPCHVFILPCTDWHGLAKPPLVLVHLNKVISQGVMWLLLLACVIHLVFPRR